MSNRIAGQVSLPAVAALLTLTFAADAGAQESFSACYVPDVGAVYLIDRADLPSACLSDAHVEVEWGGGAALTDGSIVTALLADAAVTAAKLAEGAVDSEKILDGSVADVDVAFNFAGSSSKGGIASDSDLLDGFDSDQILPGGDLPSGRTLRGVFTVHFTAQAANHLMGSPLAFGFTLASAPTPHFIGRLDPPAAGCPGTWDQPEAAPGHLCVYEQATSNIAQSSVCALGECFGEATRWGAVLLFQSSDSGLTYSRGTWAVTAP